jgi:hypothetical protein
MTHNHLHGISQRKIKSPGASFFLLIHENPTLVFSFSSRQPLCHWPLSISSLYAAPSLPPGLTNLSHYFPLQHNLPLLCPSPPCRIGTPFFTTATPSIPLPLLPSRETTTLLVDVLSFTWQHHSCDLLIDPRLRKIPKRVSPLSSPVTKVRPVDASCHWHHRFQPLTKRPWTTPRRPRSCFHFLSTSPLTWAPLSARDQQPPSQTAPLATLLGAIRTEPATTLRALLHQTRPSLTRANLTLCLVTLVISFLSYLAVWALWFPVAEPQNLFWLFGLSWSLLLVLLGCLCTLVYVEIMPCYLVILGLEAWIVWDSYMESP